MFITPAFAQAAGDAAAGVNPLLQLAPFVAVIGIMYFLIWRPQQKRMKEHRDMVAAIRRGHMVVTSGGIIGKVARVVGDDELLVEIAENVRVRVLRATVTEVRAKGEPVRSKPDDDDGDAGDDDGEDTGDKGKSAKGKTQTRAASFRSPARTGALPPQVVRGTAAGTGDQAGS